MIDVVLPCLNEAAALPWVLSRMPAGYHPIVADNGSTDGSEHIARAWGATVVRARPRGFGAAAHAGLCAARGDVVCFLDADGSLDPRQLPLVVAGVLAGQADLVLGRRRPTRTGAWPAHARLGNAAIAWHLRRRLGTAVRDLGPMRAARRSALLGLELTDRRFGYPLEMLVKAGRAGWRVSEVDIDYAPRTAGGRSKVTGTVLGTLRTIRDMTHVLAELSLSQPGLSQPGLSQAALSQPGLGSGLGSGSGSGQSGSGQSGSGQSGSGQLGDLRTRRELGP